MSDVNASPTRDWDWFGNTLNELFLDLDELTEEREAANACLALMEEDFCSTPYNSIDAYNLVETADCVLCEQEAAFEGMADYMEGHGEKGTAEELRNEWKSCGNMDFGGLPQLESAYHAADQAVLKVVGRIAGGERFKTLYPLDSTLEAYIYLMWGWDFPEETFNRLAIVANETVPGRPLGNEELDGLVESVKCCARHGGRFDELCTMLLRDYDKLKEQSDKLKGQSMEEADAVAVP